MPSPVDLKWTKGEILLLKNNMYVLTLEELKPLFPKRNAGSIQRKINKIFSKDVIQKYGTQIKEKYINGMSVLKLTSEYKISDRHIKKFLESENITIRNNPSGNLARTGKLNHSWRGYEDISASFFRCLSRDANRREIPMLITIKDIWDLFILQDRKCSISGVELIFSRDNKIRTASVDRIDSKLPYELGNIQLVHKNINIMKNNLSDEIFIEWCKVITEYQLLKSITTLKCETNYQKPDTSRYLSPEPKKDKTNKPAEVTTVGMK